MSRPRTARGAVLAAALVVAVGAGAPAVAAPMTSPVLDGGHGTAPGPTPEDPHAGMDHGDMDHGDMAGMDHGTAPGPTPEDPHAGMDHGDTGHGDADHGDAGHGDTGHGDTGHGSHGAADGGSEEHKGGHEGSHGDTEGDTEGDTVSDETRTRVLSGFGAANASVLVGALLLRRRDRFTRRQQHSERGSRR